MLTWEVLDATVRGSTHVQRGTPNQDSVATRVLADGQVAVVAISDGHGGERYVRSEVGSRFAVEISCDILSEWWTRTARGDGNAPGTALIERELRDTAIPTITRQWRARVADHVATHPFTQEEFDRAATAVDLQPEVAYGATLLVAVASDRAVALAQLGDGDIVLVRGDDVTLPIEPDARLVASQTTSLCLESADADFRCSVVDDIADLDLVLLSTDGYANSFADDEWERTVGVDLASRIAELGADAIRLQLPAWLGESAAASGDDTSVALLVPTVSTSPISTSTRPALAADSRPSGLGRALLFSAGALAIGLVAGWIWGNASADSTPSRSLPPVVTTKGTGLGGGPDATRATIVAGPDVAVAFDSDPRRPAPVRAPAPSGAGAVTRLRVGDAVWEVTDAGGLSVTSPTAGPTDLAVGTTVSAIAAAGPAIWAVDSAGTVLVPIDADTHAVSAAVPVANQPSVTTGETVPSTDASGG